MLATNLRYSCTRTFRPRRSPRHRKERFRPASPLRSYRTPPQSATMPTTPTSSTYALQTAIDPALEALGVQMAYRLAQVINLIIQNTADGAGAVDPLRGPRSDQWHRSYRPGHYRDGAIADRRQCPALREWALYRSYPPAHCWRFTYFNATERHHGRFETNRRRSGETA